MSESDIVCEGLTLSEFTNIKTVVFAFSQGEFVNVQRIDIHFILCMCNLNYFHNMKKQSPIATTACTSVHTFFKIVVALDLNLMTEYHSISQIVELINLLPIKLTVHK